MAYKKPLLVEVFAQVAFEQPCPLGTILDVVQRLRNEGYPEVEIHRKDGVAVANQGLLVTNTETFWCWAAGRQRVIQISPVFIGYNQVGDYLGWSSFAESFRKLLSVTRAELPPPITLSHNTRDALETEREGFELGCYLNCGGPVIPSSFAKIASEWDLTWGQGVPGKDEQNTQLHAALRARKSRLHLAMTLTKIHRVSKWDGLEDSLEPIHEGLVQLFESSITDFTRQQIMRGCK